MSSPGREQLAHTFASWMTVRGQFPMVLLSVVLVDDVEAGVWRVAQIAAPAQGG